MQWDGSQLRITADPGTRVALDLDGCYFSECDADANGEACFVFPYSPSGHDRLSVRAREGRNGLPLTAERALHFGSPHDEFAPLRAPPLAPLRESECLLGVDDDISDVQVVIVIPVYNAAAAVERCLRSVLQHSRGRARLIVIDDASTDAAIAPLLARYRGLPGIEILANAHNLGFTATANRGIERAGRADVVLLNADTEVGPNWLDGLRRATYARDDIATATAVSDNAGAFSVPELEQQNSVPDDWSFDQSTRALWQHAGHSYPELPTGNGFCLYIRRSVIDRIGLLDAEAFAQGYGEENDFCQRASALGLCHVIAGNVLVHHERSLSFGHERRETLGRAGMEILRQRWPDYERDVGASLFSFSRRVLDWRVRRLYAVADAGNAPQPRLLHVVTSPCVQSPDWEHWQLRLHGDQLLLLRLHSRGPTIVEQAAIATAPDALNSWLQRHAFELIRVDATQPLAAIVTRTATRLGISSVTDAAIDPSAALRAARTWADVSQR